MCVVLFTSQNQNRFAHAYCRKSGKKTGEREKVTRKPVIGEHGGRSLLVILSGPLGFSPLVGGPRGGVRFLLLTLCQWLKTTRVHFLAVPEVRSLTGASLGCHRGVVRAAGPRGAPGRPQLQALSSLSRRPRHVSRPLPPAVRAESSRGLPCVCRLPLLLSRPLVIDYIASSR